MTAETPSLNPRGVNVVTTSAPSYVLITPARNEEAFLEETIKSVVSQSVLPLRWVIVSDGSTDRTNEIAAKYAREHEWIDFVALPARKERNFAGKVNAFKAGYERVRSLPYSFIASLDADLSFDSGYFEFLLGKMTADPQLGLAGTPFREGTGQYDFRFTSREHVSGACQFFRRECFENVGGYIPLKGGGIDLVAVVTARMKGWKTWTFTEKFSIHHRPMGSAKHRRLAMTFRDGYYDYPLGVHPLYKLISSVYRIRQKPYFVAALFHLSGYVWAMMSGAHRPVSLDFVRFRRKEQMRWLKEKACRAVRGKSLSGD